MPVSFFFLNFILAIFWEPSFDFMRVLGGSGNMKLGLELFLAGGIILPFCLLKIHFLYTTEALIHTTIKISIGLNALSLPFLHLIIFDIFLQLSEIFRGN